MRKRFTTLVLLTAALQLPAAPANAHDYDAVIHATITETERGRLHSTLEMEYALLGADGAREMSDTAFEFDAYNDIASSPVEQLTNEVLESHRVTVENYVLPRWQIAPELPHGEEQAEACPSSIVAPIELVTRAGKAYAKLSIETDCRSVLSGAEGSYRLTTQLFPSGADAGSTVTIVEYQTLGFSGTAQLNTDSSPSMSTNQDWQSQLGSFFVLGAEHLLFGLDHILFLLALIIASRRLRDIVLAATAFTIAHSITFICAALGLISLPDALVEPVIALSIAAVALWYLWKVWRHGVNRPPTPQFPTVTRRSYASPTPASEPSPTLSPDVRVPWLGFERSDWVRTGVVFVFGLIHGVGFAGALGLSEPFSWGLLGALLVFNAGIEAVQLAIIALVFPILLLMRRYSPRFSLWIGIGVSAVVAVISLYWFFERVLPGA